MTRNTPRSRRELLSETLAIGAVLASARPLAAAFPTEDPVGQALIAITLDLEMSRHYPTWDQTHWDYEKGNLDADTKGYAVEAARLVKKRGGLIHFFLVGRVLEQENVDWLRALIREGHSLGNHTYDHVNVKATQPDQVQFRFERAPWLIEGKTPSQVIAENIRITSRAMRQRLGIDPAGFRTPGGFNDGLSDRPDVQEMIRGLGFEWVSSKYPAHPLGPEGVSPTNEVFDGILKAEELAQPFVYRSGLVEVPMSPISDVTAFRSGRWPLAAFLKAVRLGVSWAIERRAVFDLLVHPSCLLVADPEFRAISLICDLVQEAGDRAALVDLGTIAQRARQQAAAKGAL